MAYPTPASSFPQTQSEIEIEIDRSSPAAMIDAFSASSTATDSITSGSFDVFINHRGVDTKKTFASSLYNRLLSRGFRAFLDEEELEEGLHFPSQIAGAIQSASVHVAIFSPRYAESPWCLDELILMRKSKALIIPVFYKVMPSDHRRILNKSGPYSQGLHTLEMKTKLNPQTGSPQPRYNSSTIQNWRNVLSSFADISGFDLDGKFNGDEQQMLDKVVERVVEIMAKNTRLYVARYPTGLDDKIKDFETVLLRQQHTGKVQMVGIVGLGGIGKTTLALEFFNRRRSEYNKSHFLSGVRENSKSPGQLLQLQRELLKSLSVSYQHIDNIHEGTQKIKDYLSSSSSQFFIVLDDVDLEEQVDNLLPDREVYCSNSLILITSRDRDVLRKSGVEETSIYKLTGLSPQHSRELFCYHAFRQAYPLPEFEDLLNKFLTACQGFPLSLKVFGALLLGKNDKSFWEETLSRVHEVPDDIQKRLKISYDALHEKEQQIFLDIACFFIGEKRDMTVGIWDESGHKGSSRFQNLESKCLVEVGSANDILMHDHLRDLGREIALDKSPRRLWHPTEKIDNLLQQFPGSTEVRSIKMFLSNNTNSNRYNGTLSSRKRSQERSQELFENCRMKLLNLLQLLGVGIGIEKLQLLEIEGHLLEHILRRVHSPNLRWLSWRGCPYSYLPSWIPMQNLTVLKVEGALLKTLWRGRSQVPFQLRELEISGNLFAEIPESIGQLPSLQHMLLSACSSLERLPESFGNLPSLEHMELRGCSSLQRLPESFGNLPSLQHMELHWCERLERLPESFGNLPSLQHMELRWCESLERLPESFGNMPSLQHMELQGCYRLKRMPESFGNLPSLQHMELQGCESLERLPESFGNLPSLQHMKLHRCESLEMLPESFGNLPNLQHMELHGCKSLERLPESFGNLPSLQHMELQGGQSLERLPESFGNLPSLQHMELQGCHHLERLPESFGNLLSLQHMTLTECHSLERLQESFGNLLSLQHMTLTECHSLERLPESFGNLRSLQRMTLTECHSLETLQESFGNLPSLKYMALQECESLERLPESFGNLPNLQHMELRGCDRLGRLPESFGNLRSLQRMTLTECHSLERLPESFGNLSSLQHMELQECESLESLSHSFGNLLSLQHMELHRCSSLERLPESFGNLPRLQHMELSGCESLEGLPESLGNLLTLEHMELQECPKLDRLPESLGSLPNLQHMTLIGCVNLVRLPESFGNLPSFPDMELCRASAHGSWAYRSS